MAFRAIIKIDGITGNSPLKAGWIDITDFHWGVTNDVKAWEASPTGTANVHNFSITKRVDPATPDIFTNCVNGKALGTVEVSLVQAAGSDAPKEYANYKFTKCFIVSIHKGGSGGSDFASETVEFNFNKAEYGYGSKKGGFDVGKGGIQGQ